MASFEPSLEDLDKMKKDQIVAFLRSRGKRTTGLKDDLLAYAKLVLRNEDISIDESVLASLLEKRKIFELQTLQWNPHETVKWSDIPEGFDILVISKFLTSTVLDFGDEMIETAIDKPAKKGRRLYNDKKIQYVESSTHEDLILFRANLEASMKSNLFRLVRNRTPSPNILPIV